MRIPQPLSDETKDEFVKRCIDDVIMIQDYSDQYTRSAICRATFEIACDDSVEKQTYDDYPQAATNNAKRALKFREESGNPNNCGTPVGWTRANQLAKREKISRDTIARMALFERHRQNSQVPYEEGCGGLMWDAWGGDEGIEWAQRKLKEIDEQ